MSMAEEVKNLQANKGAVPPPVVDPAVAQVFAQPVKEEAAAQKSEAPTLKGDQSEGAPKNEEPTAKIKIGEKEFSSPAEALEYARELELRNVTDEAYKEGFQAAQPVVAVPEVSPDDVILKKIEDKFWESPAEALREYKEYITQSTEKEKARAEAQKQAEETAWKGFYEKNPDLVEFQDFVKTYTHTSLSKYGNMEASKALAAIAKDVRGMLKIREDVIKPRTELQQTSTVSLGSSGEPLAQVQKSDDPGLDFVSAVNKYRRRELKKPR